MGKETCHAVKAHMEYLLITVDEEDDPDHDSENG
jgi:hypothetical protein